MDSTLEFEETIKSDSEGLSKDDGKRPFELPNSVYTEDVGNTVNSSSSDEAVGGLICATMLSMLVAIDMLEILMSL